jgi:type I restriction-modification system DNA methylase subunit/predicted type IV restriction endonuclease
MDVPERIKKLIETFDYNLETYKKGPYNETQVRLEFINPFFEELGWDIANKQGYAEAYKDVIHEDAIKVSGVTKAPDYCFRIGGVRKFFLEAKKPAVNIKEDIHPAYQLRRYGWSAKLPLSILTDFEEFAVYDCRVKPNKTDKASHSRILFMKYTDYLERWDEISNIFSRKAIKKGSFDKYVESKKAKRGTAGVDTAFLQEIERWREILARNIALRNTELSQRELNFAIQQTIDRIVFLRICEDRGIEDYSRLMALQNGTDIYKRLFELFEKADKKYNSGLFHFKKEKGREDYDNLTPHLSIDDKILKDIFKNLYYPDSPYEFSVLPADILGQVYEKFLGKVITLTSSHKARIEEKPEVRKAGGVYYTPTYIVDYIVKQTVGKLVDGKKPGPTGAVSKLKILDPACGSGSFLIGAYQFLLNWHRDQYIADTDRWSKGKTPRIYQSGRGEWRLTTDERKRILLNNIYGVDIDHQAVEVTKLSLLLKVLEGEDEQSINKQQSLFQDRVLPDLSNNIKCGNSLIGPDFYDDQQMSLLDTEEIYRVNAFDWEMEFAEVMKNGGFDAMVGNPPYVDLKGFPAQELSYIFKSYECANNRVNLFATFMERSFSLLKTYVGYFSMIVPTAVLAQTSYTALRKKILSETTLLELVRLPNESFGSAAGEVKVDTVIVAWNSPNKTKVLTNLIAYRGYERIYSISPTTAHIHGKLSMNNMAKPPDFIWPVNTIDFHDVILKKIDGQGVPLVTIVNFCLGLTPYDKYKGHTEKQIKEKAFHSDHKRDSTYKKLLKGNDVRRYQISWNGEEWISYGEWLGAPREERFFTEKRIIVKQIIDWSSLRIWAALTSDALYNTQNAFNLLPISDISLEYILGLLNSKLINFYHRKRFLDEFKMRFQKILIRNCKRFPIRIINFDNPTEIAQHDQMVNLVNQMLTLNKQLSEAKIPHQKDMLKRQIEATDKQIDQLVYKLYDLTEEEIKIVEAEA